jgi:hypothetical protein
MDQFNNATTELATLRSTDADRLRLVELAMVTSYTDGWGAPRKMRGPRLEASQSDVKLSTGARLPIIVWIMGGSWSEKLELDLDETLSVDDLANLALAFYVSTHPTTERELERVWQLS